MASSMAEGSKSSEEAMRIAWRSYRLQLFRLLGKHIGGQEEWIENKDTVDRVK